MLLTTPTNKIPPELSTLENFPFDVLRMIGNESVDFLQRISTNDFSKFNPGGIQKTLFISEKGRVIDAAWVIHQTDYVLLLVSSGMATEVIAWLNKYVIMEDISIEDVTFQYSVHLHFSQNNSLNTEYFGFPVALSLKSKSAFTSTLSVQSFEQWRIENGIPATKKELVQDYNPLELNLWDWISFTKGCYIGQEVIARLDTYNKIQRTLCKIHSEQPIAEGDICLDTDSNQVGKITSVVKTENGFIGLAVIRAMFAMEQINLRTKNSNVMMKIEKVFQKEVNGRN